MTSQHNTGLRSGGWACLDWVEAVTPTRMGMAFGDITAGGETDVTGGWAA